MQVYAFDYTEKCTYWNPDYRKLDTVSICPTARLDISKWVFYHACMNAIAYLRVSTDEQARHGVSLDAQLERVRAYCTMTGLQLVETIREEGVSGTIPLDQRPLGKVLTESRGKLPVYLKRLGVTNIVALKLDRLFRNAENALRQTRQWTDAGIALHLIDMGGTTMTTGGAMGQMILTMFAGFAELERNLIAERTRMALQHKKGLKDAYCQNAWGFEREGKRFEENPHELALLDALRAWRDDGQTYQEIADRLNDEFIPGKRGGLWTATTVRRILNNTSLYATQCPQTCILIPDLAPQPTYCRPYDIRPSYPGVVAIRARAL